MGGVTVYTLFLPSYLAVTKKLPNPQSSAGSLPPSSPSLVAKREVLVLVVLIKTFYWLLWRSSAVNLTQEPTIDCTIANQWPEPSCAAVRLPNELLLELPFTGAHKVFLAWNGRGFCVEFTSNSAQITASILKPFIWMEIPPVSIDMVCFFSLRFLQSPGGKQRMIMSILEAVSVSKIYMTAAALISHIKEEQNKATKPKTPIFTVTSWFMFFSAENACNLICAHAVFFVCADSV